MRLNTILIAIAMTAGTAWGQSPATDTKTQPPVSHEGYEAQVIHVKTLTGDSFNRLTNMLLNVFKAGITGDANLRTIIVYGPKDVVAQVEKVVAELDTPGSEAAIGRNIEMTMTLLRCSTKESAGAKLPADIEPVAKQLRAATQYKDITVWDVIPLRLQEGKEATEEMQLSTGTEHPAMLSIRIAPEAASRKNEGWSVRFSHLNLDFRIPVVTGTFSNSADKQFSYQQVGLNTSGDFLEGQKTVLGKVSGLEPDTAIFVVISLKVLE
jgi:hypothetical protein